MRWRAWRPTRGDWRRTFRRRLVLWLADAGLTTPAAYRVTAAAWSTLRHELARLRRSAPTWAASHGAQLRRRRGKIA